ncbi:MAG: hypothetical protein ACRYFX_14970 [Janthinobacterium lividum]
MISVPTTCSATPLPRRTFLISEVTAATTRVAELSAKHPSWPSSRVRAVVARELNISTVQLRYILQKAAEAN